MVQLQGARKDDTVQPVHNIHISFTADTTQTVTQMLAESQAYKMSQMHCFYYFSTLVYYSLKSKQIIYNI